MKKLLALLLALVMIFALAACSEKEEEKQEEQVKVLTYDEFIAAETETQVVVECAVQGNQAWWEDKISVYAADENGGYFLFNMACSEEDAAKLTKGTWIRVTGTKAVWEGQIEITEATFEFIEKDAYVAPVTDVTELLGTEELETKMTLPVLFKGMKVEGVEFKNGEPGDDIYVTLSRDGVEYSFCVEVYLTGTDTAVYEAVSNLEADTLVDVEGFLYWYQGPNPHITGVTPSAE